jgi:hypothetical protein
MKKNIYVQLLFQILVYFVIYSLVDYMLEREFRLLRNLRMSIPITVFMFFMNRKKTKKNKSFV